MTKSNNEWVPEVGVECEYKTNPANNDWIRCKVIFITRFGSYLVEVCGTTEMLLPRRAEFRAIKTEAEKRRDEQIEDLALTLISNSRGSVRDSALARTLAVAVIDSGYIKPKRLTDQDIDLLLKNHWYVLGVTNRDFALAVELYVRGELGL